MNELLQTASIRLLRTRDRLPAMIEEAETLAILLASYDAGDRVAVGISRVLDRWSTAWREIETELDQVQRDLREPAPVDQGGSE